MVTVVSHCGQSGDRQLADRRPGTVAVIPFLLLRLIRDRKQALQAVQPQEKPPNVRR